MSSVSVLSAIAVAVLLALHLYRLARHSRTSARQAVEAATASVRAIVQGARDAPNGTVGVTTWAGTWKGERVQVRTIIDTLATRKLPAFWLSVTVTEKVAVDATFDMMMRPAAPTSFSNFDNLPHTLRTPPDFPDGAVICSDKARAQLPLETIAGHLGVFTDGRAKELLVTRNGIRIVWLLAEADRVRYGVFRQAEFSGAALDPDLLEVLLGEISALRAAVNSSVRRAVA